MSSLQGVVYRPLDVFTVTVAVCRPVSALSVAATAVILGAAGRRGTLNKLYSESGSEDSDLLILSALSSVTGRSSF